MNWYEHHIGDYDKNTSHLTACEDGIYSRLIRRYYDKEKPLPADVGEVKRLARARARDEREAVESVLREFFRLEADGWHHDKCDEVIAAYQAGEPEREAKKKNEDTRLARHRAERAELFSIINAHGAHRPYNTPIGDLRALVAGLLQASPATIPATGAAAPATQPATAPATPATATQPPPTISHPPPTNLEVNTPPTPQGGDEGGQPDDQQPKLPGEDDPLFVAFYAAYPRKTGRADAWKAWKALKVTPTMAHAIMAGLGKWQVHGRWTKEGGRFIKTPAPWLRGRLWEDEEVCGATAGRDTEAVPEWCVRAGFDSVDDAHNRMCWAHNAHEFRGGERIREGAPA